MFAFRKPRWAAVISGHGCTIKVGRIEHIDSALEGAAVLAGFDKLQSELDKCKKELHSMHGEYSELDDVLVATQRRSLALAECARTILADKGDGPMDVSFVNLKRACDVVEETCQPVS